MGNDYLDNLLDYLSTLAQVQASGHYVNEEIKEVIREIRIELGLEKKQRRNLRDSRKLAFEGKLGKVSFIQQCLFMAVFESESKIVLVPFSKEEQSDVEKAVEVLRGMSKNVTFEIKDDVVEVTK